MILSDSELIQALDLGLLSVVPANPGAVQPASIDLCIGAIDRDDWTLRPGEFRLGATLEVVTISAGFAAQLSGRSTWGRRGLQVHATAGWIDPGFSGQITLELANLTDGDLVLEPGASICQLIVMRLGMPAVYPYGTERLRSRYQHQRGVVGPREVLP